MGARIRADNGNVLALTSKGYENVKSLKKDMDRIRTPAIPPECYLDGNKEWRWRWPAFGGSNIIKASEGYKNRTDCEAIAVIVWEFVKGNPFNE